MHLTVAICTWNRAGLLDRTLDRMADVRLPAGVSWELLVVNNNCTDGTDAVLARHAAAGRLPLRRLFEPTPGQSHARNRAVAAAAGDLILWTDDDVLVEPDWAAEYLTAARDWPAASYFGGTIDPWFEAAPPGWVLRHLTRLQGTFVVRQLGPGVRPLAPDECPFGANMAFRTAVLREHPFDGRLCRTGKGLVGSDDIELIDRIKAAGHSGVWVGPARVRHFIPRERLTQRYVWRWFVGQGQTQVRREGMSDVARVFGVPRYTVRKFAAAAARAARLAPGKSDRWLDAFTEAAITWGRAVETRRAAAGAAQ